jgi:tetratricopeptide (TPR) repeat protein
MQTTLLGIAIAIILALVAALVAPLFVDFESYRAQFEQRASLLVGQQVHINGPIDVRLLPTPTLTLQNIEIGSSEAAAATRIRKLTVEFSLNAAAQGELRASNMHVDGAEFSGGLDGAGRLVLPISAAGPEPNLLAVEQFDVVNSRAVLSDARSATQVVLEKFGFAGNAGSLAGLAKGAGSFSAAEKTYNYRLSVSRPGKDGMIPLRLLLTSSDQSFSADLDASIWIGREGSPRFDGDLRLARPVQRRGEAALAFVPWRLSSRIRGDSSGATLEQVEIEFGRDDRAVKMRGNAEVNFDGLARLSGALFSSVIDADRLLASSSAEARPRPLAMASIFADVLASVQPSVPVELRIGIDNLTLAGGTLQHLNCTARSDANGWEIQNLEFRAPGSTQVRLSGRLSSGSDGVVFAGPTQLETPNPRALVAWTARVDPQTLTSQFRADGILRIGGSKFAIDQLRAEVGRTTLNGAISYAWPSGAQPARLDATLDVPEIDLDFAYAPGLNLSGIGLELPKEGAIALSIGKALLAGIAAERLDIRARFDQQLLDIERLSIGQLGGSALVAKGSLDVHNVSPQGTLSLDLDARALDGVIALLAKIAPQTSDQLRRRAGQLVPTKLSGSLSLSSDSARASDPARVKLKIDGRAGAFGGSLTGEGELGGALTALDSLVTLEWAKTSFVGDVSAADGRALLELFGLDHMATVDARPGRLSFTAAGPLKGEMPVTAQLVAGGLDVSAIGTLQLLGVQTIAANLEIRAAASGLKTWRSDEALPVELSATLTAGNGLATLAGLAGKVAGTDLSGSLAIDLKQPVGVHGEIKLGAGDLPTFIALAIGMPKTARSSATWSEEPFEASFLGSIIGEVKISLTEVAITPRLAARNVHSGLNFDHSMVTIDNLDGEFAGGRITGRLAVSSGTDGVGVGGRVRIQSADLSMLFPGNVQPPLSGAMTAAIDLEGSGRSPTALVGSLSGGGSFALRDGGISAFDVAALGTVIRSMDHRPLVESTRIAEEIERALDGGSLSIRLGEGKFKVSAGRLELDSVVLRGEGGDPKLSGNVDFHEKTLAAQLTLIGPAELGADGSGRPEIVVSFKGPIDAPKRLLDVTALSNWLALRAVDRQAKKLETIEEARESPAKNAPPTAKSDTAPARAEPPQARAEPPQQLAAALNRPTEPVGNELAVAPPLKSNETQTSEAVEPTSKERPAIASASQNNSQQGNPKGAIELPHDEGSVIASVPPKAEAPERPRPAAEEPAISELNTVIEENPKNTAARNRRGQLLALRGDFGRAILDFDEVIRHEPKNAEALNNRCWARAITGDPQAALKDCNEALQIRPRFADALDSRGFIYLKINQPGKAIADYDAVLRLNPKHASSLFGRGIAKLRSGNTVDAINDIAAAKSIQPNVAEEFASYGVR